MGNKIDINQADRDTLAGLSGIGEKLADRIIEYRETSGPFSEVYDLTAVPGISENMVREIEDYLTVAANSEKDAAKPTEERAIEEIAGAAIIGEEVEEAETSNEAGAKPEAGVAERNEEPLLEEIAGAAIIGEEVEKAETPNEAGAKPEADVAERNEEPPLEEIAGATIISEDNQQEETAAEIPVKPASAVEQSSNSPAPAPARSGFWQLLFTAIAGALLGTVFTLTIIWLLNGSLQLNETAQMSAFEQKSAQAAATSQAVQSGLRRDLQLVSKENAVMRTRENELTAELATAQTGLVAAHNRLDDAMEALASLEEVTDDLDERITAVAASAENFDTFLVGMRDLLWSVQGPPPTPDEVISTPAPTRLTATATPTATIDATATSTSRATRTPRPTATPLRETRPTATK